MCVSRIRRTVFIVLTSTLLCLAFVKPLFADGSYIVQWGDTLSEIAVKFGMTTAELAQANGIYNPDHIYAGQALVIPGYESDSEPEGEETAADPEITAAQNELTAAETQTTYIVQRGDTLFRIANRFGVTTQQLVQYNEIWNPSHIYAGQVLTIPDPNSTPLDELQTLPNASYSYGERWIEVDLTVQRLIAYEEERPVYTTAVSSGLWPYVTVTGLYKVYLRYESQTMNGYRLGYDYYLENVPYVMYFYRDFSIHGTYWHNNFGSPMSHGCVNTPTPAAQWLYNWSDLGTPVYIHY
ncbi:MAG: LysM peptidoglycan-binding domain-containing protein [Candidatus Promineifilaceae bacterium]